MRFSLMTLLLAFVVVWSSLATFGVVGGIWAAAFLLGIAAYVRTADDMGKAIVRVVVVTLLVLVLIALLLPAAQGAREAARRAHCGNNLRQIAMALCNYHDTYGCFPPAYVAGRDGTPWHSWRVLILPYVDEQPLYDRYDFDEPWDGPNNRKLAGQRPEIYVCPTDPDRLGSTTTSYAAVVGPEAAWARAEPRTLDDFRDGTANTILVVETAGSAIHWMEPRDVSFDDARTGIHAPGQGMISGHHMLHRGHFYHDEPGGANVAMADVSVRFLPERITPAALEAMLTINGGEPADLRELAELPWRPYWSHIFAPIVLIVSYLLLLLRPRSTQVASASENAAPRASLPRRLPL